MARFDIRGGVKLLELEWFEQEAFVEKLVLVHCDVFFKNLMLVGHLVCTHLGSWVEVDSLRNFREFMILSFV